MHINICMSPNSDHGRPSSSFPDFIDNIADGRVKYVCLCSTNHTIWSDSMIGRAQAHTLDSASNKNTYSYHRYIPIDIYPWIYTHKYMHMNKCICRNNYKYVCIFLYRFIYIYMLIYAYVNINRRFSSFPFHYHTEKMHVCRGREEFLVSRWPNISYKTTTGIYWSDRLVEH
jgi:hypothetical protein